MRQRTWRELPNKTNIFNIFVWRVFGGGPRLTFLNIIGVLVSVSLTLDRQCVRRTHDILPFSQF